MVILRESWMPHRQKPSLDWMLAASEESKGVYGGSWNKINLSNFGFEEDNTDKFVISFDFSSLPTVNIVTNHGMNLGMDKSQAKCLDVSWLRASRKWSPTLVSSLEKLFSGDSWLPFWSLPFVFVVTYVPLETEWTTYRVEEWGKVWLYLSYSVI